MGGPTTQRNPDLNSIRRSHRQFFGVVLVLLVVVLFGLVPRAVRSLIVTHRVVATYTALLTAAHEGDLATVRRLCSARYLHTHSLSVASEGGVVGFPRGIHKNFQVWRAGPNVWLCPTNRIGPVYQFVAEAGSWRFDGPVGVLYPGGRMERSLDEGVPD